MRGKAHDDETRAQVVAALLAGQGIGEVAERYKLPEKTVRNWRKKIPEGRLAEVAAKKEDEFGELLSNYLREIVTTLQVQARFARDTEWLKKLSGTEVAILHGVLCDKGIRLLEAAEQAREDAEPAVS